MAKEIRLQSWLKGILKQIPHYYFVIALALCAGMVAITLAYRTFVPKASYVYVKVKVGQGLWWASTNKPNGWFLKEIHPGIVANDLSGRPLAEITDVTYYPYWSSNQYDVYVQAKLRISRLGQTQKYNFNRLTIGVGTPIDFEFPTVQFSGTIMEMSKNPIRDSYTEKTIYLVKKYAFPWEYDAIEIGDSYFDGKSTAFTVLDKSSGDANEVIPTENSKYVNGDNTEPRKFIYVKARVKLKNENGILLYNEEQPVLPGKSIYVSTSRFSFNDFIVEKVE